jgi:hypothetical protein
MRVKTMSKETTVEGYGRLILEFLRPDGSVEERYSFRAGEVHHAGTIIAQRKNGREMRITLADWWVRSVNEKDYGWLKLTEKIGDVRKG